MSAASSREGARTHARSSARQRRRRRQTRLALNLTAMIDVTFLLLIYFMVATEFKLGEEIYRLDLPERSPSQQERDPFDLDEEPLRIRVATVGGSGAEYSLRLDGHYPQPKSFGDLHEFLQRRRINEDVPGGLFAPDHPIVIVPTPTTTWQHTVQVFNAAARARYTNVTFGKPG